MAKYVFPAIFTADEDCFLVSFPDIEGCNTFGDTMAEAIEMAQDALCLILYDMEETGKPLPQATDIQTIKTDKNSIVSLISCDTVEYRKYFDNKAIKKTLTIPNWLNTLAERADINFSQTLQNALKEQLHID